MYLDGKNPQLYLQLYLQLLRSEYLCPPQNSYVEILMLDVMVLVSGAFGRCLSPEGGTLINGASAL